MAPSKKRSATHGSKPSGARSHREKVQIEHKLLELRVLSLQLRGASASGAPEESDALFKQLRELAFAPNGFVSDELRKQLWPWLLGDRDFKPVSRESSDHFTKKNAPHRDDQQIQKDIDRSMWHYDVLSEIRESERRVKRKQLTQVINAVLSENSELYYYQGYHDVCSVFLLVLGDQLAFRAVDRVSTTYQREPMRKNFEIVLHATRLLYPLIETEDPDLFAHIKESGVEPFFALPWVITWFAHQLHRFSSVTRLYDVLLVSHPLFILYLSAAVVVEARQRVLKTDCDFGTLHGLLAKLPQTMDIERVISRAAVIFHRYPPDKLLQTSEHQPELESSMYAQFPLPFHAHFPSIAQPFLSPVQYQKLEFPDHSVVSATPSKWHSPTIVRVAFIGLVAIAMSYALRHQLGARLSVLSGAGDFRA